MENLLLQNSSPTLGVETQSKDKTPTINKLCKIFNSKEALLHIVAFVDGVQTPLVVSLSEIPDEIRQGIHDFTTRLIAERLREQ